jgi:hypothetical protein
MPDTLVASFDVAHRFWCPTTVRVPEVVRWRERRAKAVTKIPGLMKAVLLSGHGG